MTTHDERTRSATAGLEVLVSAGCTNCARALHLVEAFRRSHPHVEVRVTDVDEPGWIPPPRFLGTPMYLAEGRILFLGNPSPEALRAAFPPGGP
jgi:hypothetical protein